MNVATLISDYCAPMRHVEQWLASRRSDFGKIAKFPAFARVEAYLRNSRARSAVVQCMRPGMRLDGTSDEHPGIEQCRVLVREMRALKNPQREAGAAAVAEGHAEPPATDGLGDTTLNDQTVVSILGGCIYHALEEDRSRTGGRHGQDGCGAEQLGVLQDHR